MLTRYVVGLSCLLAATNTGLAGISVDANVSVDQASATAKIVSPAFSTTAGNELLLAFISADWLSGPNTTVTGITGGGLTWTLVVRANGQSGTSEIWRAFASATLSSVSVIATFSQAVVCSMTVMSFAGVDPSGINGTGAIGATASTGASPVAPTATLVNDSKQFVGLRGWKALARMGSGMYPECRSAHWPSMADSKSSIAR